MQPVAAELSAAPSVGMPLRRLSGSAFAGLIALAALWFVLCWQLSNEWSLNEQYNYGWFVPFFALYLFWLRWEDRPEPEVRSQKSEVRGQRSEVGRRRALVAALVGIPALLLLLPVRLFEIGNPDWRPLSWLHAAAVTALTLLYIWYRGGIPWLRHFAFPILFIFVAVPWVTPVEVPIVQGLMQVVAAIASEVAALFGIPAQLKGNLIRIPNGLVGVNEACSGVRSLQTSLMIGLLFGELKRLSILRRVALIVGALAIAFIGNCGRAFFLVWIAETKGVAAVDQWHDLAGYSIVAAVFVGSMVLAAMLSRKKAEVRSQKSEVRGQRSEVRRQLPASQGSFFVLPAVCLVVAFCWLGFIEIASEAWYRSHEQHLAPLARWTVQWPKDAPGFREIKIDEAVRGTLRYDDGREVVWNTLSLIPKSFGAGEQGAPARCILFAFRWKPGSTSVVRARAHRPDICLPSAGWHQISDRGVTNYVVAEDFSIPFHHITFARGRPGVVAHTFFCLQEDQLHPTESRPDLQITGAHPKRDWWLAGRFRVVFNGVRNLGQQVMELIFVSSREVDDATAERKFVELIPKLIKVEDAK